jgi:3-dehydrosphinganine reductase
VTDPARTVFISGGGSGIGASLARHYAGRGHAVAVFDLAISKSIRRELTGTAGSPACCFHEVDIRDSAGLAEAVGSAVAAVGAPRLAVNCAGVQDAGCFLDLSEERFSRVVDINLKGSRNFAAAVLPHMGRGGKLAFVASLAGVVPSYAYTAYSASKFGVVGMAGALRLECLPLGIDVAVVCPPEVDTPMVDEELKTMDPITRELKQAAGTLDLASACREIIAGLEGDDFLIVPGARARMIERLTRWLPGLVRRKSDRVVMKMSAGDGR